MVEALGWAAFVGGLVGTLVLMADRGFKDGTSLAWFLATLAVPAWFNVFLRSITLDAGGAVRARVPCHECLQCPANQGRVRASARSVRRCQ